MDNKHDSLPEELAWLRDNTAYLADEGFSESVMQKLPPSRRSRRLIYWGSLSIATLVLGGIALSGSWHESTMAAMGQPLLFGSIIVMAMLGSYLALSEGLVEI